MLAIIEASLPDLRPAEQAVARIVLADPQAVLQENLAQFGNRSGVSDPTVIRFCRAVGFAGFQDFKLKLAQHLAAEAARSSLAGGPVALVRDLSPADSVAGAAEKVLNRSIDALTRLRDRLDAVALERAARALLAAPRVAIFGVGASGAVAQDAHHKLFRLLPAVSAVTDAHMQVMAAATLGTGDVALLLSKTGTSVETVRAAALARAAGATVVAVSSPASPLADEASILLAVEVDEDTAVHTPMASRLAQLAIVDALTVAIGLLSPPDLGQRLARIKAALGHQHHPENTPRTNPLKD